MAPDESRRKVPKKPFRVQEDGPLRINPRAVNTEVQEGGQGRNSMCMVRDDASNGETPEGVSMDAYADYNCPLPYLPLHQTLRS